MNQSPNSEEVQQPLTQEKNLRIRWPAFARDFPRREITPDPTFKLIPEKELNEKLATVDPSIADSIRAQLAHLDKELMGLFRTQDAEAKVGQNQYRKFQLAFIVLALIATVIGSLQGLARDSEITLSVLALLETVVALFAVFVSRLAAHDSPLTRWLSNRRHAEGLRQEFFRYLMYAAPYDDENTARREILLAQRAAEIHRGNYPEIDEGE